MSVFVKICGMTRGQDVSTAVAAGADAVGFVFAPGKRCVDAARACELAADIAGGALRVGLFMDQAASAVARVLDTVTLDLLQFHGAESNDFCNAFGIPFIKAVSMAADDPGREAEQFPDASGILFDSHAPGAAGGTGKTFDWRRVPRCRQRVWLAGGLNPENVALAVATARPWAVDVSSGVEDGPGRKNPTLVRAFVTAAKRAGGEQRINQGLP